MSPPSPVGPHDHHAARAVPVVRGSGEARGLAARLERERGVLRGDAPLRQPPLQCRELIFAVFTSLQDPSEE